jgi:transposase
VGCGRKGKGSSLHVLTDGAGIPLVTVLTGAQVHDGQAAMDLVDGVWVPRARGRPKQRPKALAADKGYDSREFRQELRRRGIRPSIPQRVWPGRRRKPGRPPVLHPASAARWIVERTHAWLDNWRRLVVRWERHAHLYLALVFIACFMTCLRRISG